MTLIAFDDTDSKEGMCTTYVMAQFIRELRKHGIDIIGYPKLVRLNPNIPYKTRGNGALCVEVGRGIGASIQIAEWEGEEIRAYKEGASNAVGDDDHDNENDRDNKGDDDTDTGRKAYEIACNMVEHYSEMDIEGTDPGVVMFASRPHRDFYLKTLREVVTIPEAERFIETNHGKSTQFKSGRGIIGASAACAWTPLERSYEIISYRFPHRFGTRRDINKNSVIAMDTAYPSTFCNIDLRNDHIAISPSSPCPVLHGIRGKVPGDLIQSAALLEGEESQGFVIFETNQATDEHLVPRQVNEVKPYESVILKGSVVRNPRDLPGGHVVISLSDDTGSIDCTAYEPTKEFRSIVRRLYRGDEILVSGGIREEPFTVNLEKLHIIHLVPRMKKVSNPICAECGKAMKSIGMGQGYRCKRCGTKAGEGEVTMKQVDAGISPGWYEVPVCARRHLHKPLKLMETTETQRNDR